MIDHHTKYHFYGTLLLSFLITLFVDARWGSIITGTVIITWQLCQAQYLHRNKIQIILKPIGIDIVTGLLGTAIGCNLAQWANNIIQSI